MEPHADVVKILVELVETYCALDHHGLAQRMFLLADITQIAERQGLTPESLLIGGRGSAERYLRSLILMSINDGWGQSDTWPWNESNPVWSQVRSLVLTRFLTK